MLVVPDELMQQLVAQAEKEEPSECCGMIFGPKESSEELTRVRACQNVYDDYHKEDPDNFPRSSKTAYFIDPKELLAIQKELREKEEEIRIIYHSHINVGDYFSDEDQRVAISEGMPAYPGVAYLVMSVIEGKVVSHKIYYWNSKEKKFT